MKKILIPVSIIAVLLCTAAKDADQTVISPDRLFLADNGKSLFVTNRAGSELIKMSADGKEMEQKVEFSSPVNAMTQDPDGNLWVVCDGNYGMMYQLDFRYSLKQKAVLLLRIFCTTLCLNHFG